MHSQERLETISTLQMLQNWAKHLSLKAQGEAAAKEGDDSFEKGQELAYKNMDVILDLLLIRAESANLQGVSLLKLLSPLRQDIYAKVLPSWPETSDCSDT